MAGEILKLPGTAAAPRGERHRADTLELTREAVESWRAPAFQRPLRVNAKVTALAEEIASSGVIPGVLTLGEMGGATYVVDGQHRVEALKLSGRREAYADVRVIRFESLAEMGEEFVRLNQSLVRMYPDDMLRGLEGSHEGVRKLRRACPFIGYGQVRRGTPNSPLLSASLAIRAWFSGAPEVPASNKRSVVGLAGEMDADEVDRMVEFYTTLYDAFGGDQEYWRLWSALNVAILAWLWRRVTLNPRGKVTHVPRAMFKKCLMSLSATPSYLDWLVGRQFTDRDRSPAFCRVKAVFVRRVSEEMRRKVYFPSPGWAHEGGSKSRG